MRPGVWRKRSHQPFSAKQSNKKLSTNNYNMKKEIMKNDPAPIRFFIFILILVSLFACGPGLGIGGGRGSKMGIPVRYLSAGTH